MPVLKVGSRPSKLARTQVQEVLCLLGQPIDYELKIFKTRGDIDKATPLTAQPADDFFTDALDAALLKNEIDIAVHSVKDVPKILPPGLDIFALTAPLDDTDAWVGPLSWSDLPAGAKVGTSSLLRQTQVKALRDDLQIVDIRGTIEERLKLVDKKQVDGIIVASCALKRLGMADAIRDVLPWEGTPLQGQLAVVGRTKDFEIKEIFKKIDVRRTYGRVTLVGAGPGDPELITLKAVNALGKADCVFYDYLVDAHLLSYAPRAEHVYAGKRKGEHSLAQEELSRMLKNKAMEGREVVRLKGGDPLIFGRGADEIEYLTSYHIEVDIVPGLSSATGIPSYLGVPLTARGRSSSVAFISAHQEDEKNESLPLLIPTADSLVFLMGLTKLAAIVAALKAKGLSDATPVLIVSRGTRLDEQIVHGDLNTIEFLCHEADLKPPALIIVGKTTQFYRRHRQKTYLHCGTHPQLYHHLGRVIAWPMIDIKPIELKADDRQKLARDFDAADLVVLTSPAGVRHFMPVILKLKSLLPANKIFAVIGRQTARELEIFGGHAHIISYEETAQGLFDTLSAIMPLRGKKILLPRSALPNPFLRKNLEHQGALVTEWAVYDNIKPPRRNLPDAGVDGVIFTSPSTVKNFLQDYHRVPAPWTILAKGPVTQAALKEAGYDSKIIYA